MNIKTIIKYILSKKNMSDAETETTQETIPFTPGDYLGYVKWFDDAKGFGFVKILTAGEHYDSDIFVHQSNIRPSRSTYRTLRENECITFNLSEDARPQALDVTGVNGKLFCDSQPAFKGRRNTNGHQGGHGGHQGGGHQGGQGGHQGAGNWQQPKAGMAVAGRQPTREELSENA
jgi:cold shock CspA family protein